MEIIQLVLVGVAFLVLGISAGYFIRQLIAKRQEGTIETRVNNMINDARDRAEDIINRARQDSEDLRADIRKEEREKNKLLLKREEQILKREGVLDKQSSEIQKQQDKVQQELQEATEQSKEVASIKKDITKKLEKVASLNKEEAKKTLFKNIETEHQKEIQDRLAKLEQIGKVDLENRARNIIVNAVQRYAVPQVQELTTSVVNLPNDEIKGRIIGKEGRNIKTIERLTGVDVIIDDTPESIVLSSFDNVRRFVAKLSLEKLIKDGRIQPAKIEEAVLNAQEEINVKIKEAGEAALYDAGIVGIDPKLVWLLGRLRFRTSYGQNVLMHSLEVCHIAGMIAVELGADVVVSKKGGLFHDIGKALDHEVEGSHVEIGMKLLEKYGIPKPVIDAMKSHHEEYPYESLEARIVQAADAISASRPGARRDTVENYLHRLNELENVATSFNGVEKVYAISAGREVRVFVTPDKIDDTEAQKLARDIANKIQEDLKYPGEIKVTLIRENRIVEYAR